MSALSDWIVRRMEAMGCTGTEDFCRRRGLPRRLLDHVINSESSADLERSERRQLCEALKIALADLDELESGGDVPMSRIIQWTNDAAAGCASLDDDWPPREVADVRQEGTPIVGHQRTDEPARVELDQDYAEWGPSLPKKYGGHPHSSFAIAGTDGAYCTFHLVNPGAMTLPMRVLLQQTGYEAQADFGTLTEKMDGRVFLKPEGGGPALPVNLPEVVRAARFIERVEGGSPC